MHLVLHPLLTSLTTERPGSADVPVGWVNRLVDRLKSRRGRRRSQGMPNHNVPEACGVCLWPANRHENYKIIGQIIGQASISCLSREPLARMKSFIALSQHIQIPTQIPTIAQSNGSRTTRHHDVPSPRWSGNGPTYGHRHRRSRWGR
jgi:hypothetical protein